MIQFHKLPACDRYYDAPALTNAFGIIPMFLDESNPRPAREQFASNYIDGWRPTQVGFKLSAYDLVAEDFPSLCYPGDPPLPPLAYARLREELIIVYPSAWVMVMQADGSYEVVRMD